MINKINNISFEGRFHLNGYSKHTPKARPFEEFHFMPELQKQNSVKEFFKNMYKTMKDIVSATKPGNLEKTENVKNFSTVERNGSGMFFEA